MSSLDNRLERHAHVAPPANLDRHVHDAMLATLREQREALADATEAPLPTSAPVRLPWAERCVYGVGLVTYGAHALGMLARLVWRAVTG